VKLMDTPIPMGDVKPNHWANVEEDKPGGWGPGGVVSCYPAGFVENRHIRVKNQRLLCLVGIMREGALMMKETYKPQGAQKFEQGLNGEWGEKEKKVLVGRTNKRVAGTEKISILGGKGKGGAGQCFKG